MQTDQIRHIASYHLQKQPHLSLYLRYHSQSDVYSDSAYRQFTHLQEWQLMAHYPQVTTYQA